MTVHDWWKALDELERAERELERAQDRVLLAELRLERARQREAEAKAGWLPAAVHPGLVRFT